MAPGHHHHHAILHHLLTCLLLSAADDSDFGVMLNLLSSLSPCPTGWSTATPFCNWPNVTCDSTSSFVTAINLDSASLSGPLPSFKNMSFLRTLNLSNNGFSFVPKNFLLGLPNLQTLSISENFNLEPWLIPSYLAESTSLISFYARNASLTGAIPDIFAPLTNLENLRLSHNHLSGTLPESLSGSRIKNLWLNDQKPGLSGGIGELSTMTELYVVWLHGNKFSGAIPDLSKCVDLLDLQLRDNQLTGVVPPSLMALPKLDNITLQNNKLQGPFPRFRSRVNATIGTNRFCLAMPGPCDPQVAALLDVASALGFPPSLVEAWVGNDACKSWRFVRCDSQGRDVTSVNMGEQWFSGSISPAFAKLKALKDLVLSDNNLSGVIPSEITFAALPQLRVFDVSNNNLSGRIPVFPQSVRFQYNGNKLLGKLGGALPGTNGSRNWRRKLVTMSILVGGVVCVISFGLILLYLKKVDREESCSRGGVEEGRETTNPNGDQRPPGGVEERRQTVNTIGDQRPPGGHQRPPGGVEEGRETANPNGDRTPPRGVVEGRERANPNAYQRPPMRHTAVNTLRQTLTISTADAEEIDFRRCETSAMLDAPEPESSSDSETREFNSLSSPDCR